MIIYDYKRKERKTSSKSEPMKYKMVNKLKEVVNRLIENNFEPIEGDFHPRTVRRLSRIKVFACSPKWGRLIQVRKGKIYPLGMEISFLNRQHQSGARNFYVAYL